MESFVVIYRFNDIIASENFEKGLKDAFPLHDAQVVNGIYYFALTARNLPEIESKINVILDRVPVGDTDYVAVYYDRKEDSDEIKRAMVLGTSQYIDNEIKNKGGIHTRVLTELLESNIIKRR
ncbi:MAG: hypothetical protein ACK40G_01285 [Cytophagaceae bacterium]